MRKLSFLIVAIFWLLSVSIFGQGAGAPPAEPPYWPTIGDGLKGDSTDETALLRAALNLAAIHTGYLRLDSGVYLLTDSIAVPEGVTFEGNRAKLQFEFGGTKKALCLESNTKVSGFIIDVDSTTAITGHGSYGTPIIIGNYETGVGYSQIEISDVTLHTEKWDGNGMVITGNSHDIELRNLSFPNATQMLRAILLHWGNTAIDTVADTGSTTHPHNITIDGVTIDTMSGAGNIAIYLSGVYNSTISHVNALSVHKGITVTSGDAGYGYADTTLYDRGELYGQNILFSDICFQRTVAGGFVIDGKAGWGGNVGADSVWSLPVTLERCFFDGRDNVVSSGIYITNCTDVKIDHCKTTGYLNGFDAIGGVVRSTVLNSQFTNNAGSGVSIAADALEPEDILIKNCYIANNRTDGSGVYDNGITIGKSKRVTVTGCKIGLTSSEGALYGIWLGAQSVDNILAGNYVFDVYDSSTAGAYYIADDSNILAFNHNLAAAPCSALIVGPADHPKPIVKTLDEVDDTIPSHIEGQLKIVSPDTVVLTVVTFDGAERGLTIGGPKSGGGPIRIQAFETTSPIGFFDDDGGRTITFTDDNYVLIGETTSFYSLPKIDGAAGYVMETDGSGTLSWTSQGVGSGDDAKADTGVAVWDLPATFILQAGSNIIFSKVGPDTLNIAGPAAAGTKDSVGVDTDGVPNTVEGYLNSYGAGPLGVLSEGSNVTFTLTGDTLTIASTGGAGVWSIVGDTNWLIDAENDTLAKFWDNDADAVTWELSTDQSLSIVADTGYYGTIDLLPGDTTPLNVGTDSSGRFNGGNIDAHFGNSVAGIVEIGKLHLGMHSDTTYNSGLLDVDQVVQFGNKGTPTGPWEFLWYESNNNIRFGIPSSANGVGTYNPRSFIIAGPSILNDTICYGSYWGFDALSMITSTQGADLGVQQNIQVLDTIFFDSGAQRDTISATEVGEFKAAYDSSQNLTANYETITNVAKIGDDTTNFKTAYGWGDHSIQNYLDNDDANVDTAAWNAASVGAWVASNDTMFLIDATGDTLAAFWDDNAGHVRWQVATEDQTLYTLMDTLIVNKYTNLIFGVDIDLNDTDNVTIDARTNPRTVTMGALRLNHTPEASTPGTRAILLDVDANSVPGTQGLHINYEATGLEDGEVGLPIDVECVTSTSIGGVIRALEVSRSGIGAATVHGLHASAGVNPIHQEAGSFATPTQVWGRDTSLTAWANLTSPDAVGSSVIDSTLFAEVDDYLYVGNITTFNEIDFVFNTFAGGSGISPSFEFSIAGPGWTTFTPIDNTDGCRADGGIEWEVADLTSWASVTVNAVASYYIRILRNQGGGSTDPIEDRIRTSTTTEYQWDSSGAVTVKNIFADSADIDTITANKVKTSLLMVGTDSVNVFGYGLVNSDDSLKVDTAAAVADAEPLPVTGNAVYDWVIAQSYLTSETDPVWVSDSADYAFKTWVSASYAPLASPTFTGTVTIPTPFTLGAVSVTATGTELNYVDGVTSAIQTQLDGMVKESDFDATTFLYATSDDTPQPKTPAEVKAILDLEIGTDVLAQQTIGIADDNLVEVDDADAADDDYAKFTANGLEGRSFAEIVSDLGLDAKYINEDSIKDLYDEPMSRVYFDTTDAGSLAVRYSDTSGYAAVTTIDRDANFLGYTVIKGNVSYRDVINKLDYTNARAEHAATYLKLPQSYGSWSAADSNKCVDCDSTHQLHPAFLYTPEGLYAASNDTMTNGYRRQNRRLLGVGPICTASDEENPHFLVKDEKYGWHEFFVGVEKSWDCSGDDSIPIGYDDSTANNPLYAKGDSVFFRGDAWSSGDSSWTLPGALDHLSDQGLFLNPNDTLFMPYRGSYVTGAPDTNFIALGRTGNGYQWSEAVVILSEGLCEARIDTAPDNAAGTKVWDFMSPTIIPDTGGTYEGWTIEKNNNAGNDSTYIIKWEAPQADSGWRWVRGPGALGRCIYTPTISGREPWHMRVKRRGQDEYWAIIGEQPIGETGANSYLTTAVSYDGGLTWQSSDTVLAKGSDPWNDGRVYFGDGAWVDEGNRSYFELYYTAYGAGHGWATAQTELFFGTIDTTDPNLTTYVRGVANDTADALRNGDTWTGAHDAGGATSWEMPNSAAPTVDAEGEYAWETDDDDLHIYDGSNDIVIASKTQTRSFVIGLPDDTWDFPFWQTKRAITITAVSALCTGGTNLIGALQEYNATGTSVDAAVDADWTITTSEYTDASFTNPAIDAGDWVGWKTTSVSGSVVTFSITFEYYEQ